MFSTVNLPILGLLLGVALLTLVVLVGIAWGTLQYDHDFNLGLYLGVEGWEILVPTLATGFILRFAHMTWRGRIAFLAVGVFAIIGAITVSIACTGSSASSLGYVGKLLTNVAFGVLFGGFLAPWPPNDTAAGGPQETENAQ